MIWLILVSLLVPDSTTPSVGFDPLLLQCITTIATTETSLDFTFSLPALVKELDGEADDFVVCYDSLVLVCHLATILV